MSLLVGSQPAKALWEEAGTDFAKTQALGEDDERLEAEIAAHVDEGSQIAL